MTVSLRSHIKFLTVVIFIAASALYGQSQDAACTMCHGNNSLSMTRQGRSVSLFVDGAKLKASVHGALSCSSCHANYNAMAIPHANPVPPVNCESCHNIQGFAESVHMKSGAATCKSCHGTHEVKPVRTPASGLMRTSVAESCGKCHAAESEAYKTSEHALALERMPQSPTCVTCHGAHGILSVQSGGSPLRKENESDFCLNCHLRDSDIRNKVGISEYFMSGYESGVHGQARAAGNDKSATCGDCHGVHDVMNSRRPLSTINRWNVDDSCGKCHMEAAAAYKDSSHGYAVARGNSESPTCTTCHGDHHIYPTQDPRSAVSHANLAEHTCADCHNSLRFSQRYGIASDRFASFISSFHGPATRGGSLKTPNCANCHGTHNIKSASDTDSAIHVNNLTTTCGNCHPGANENFSLSKVHVGKTGGAAYWIRIIYIVLIVVTIGLMFLHNLFDFIRQSRRHKEIPPAAVHSPKQYVRMTRLDRVQHAGLLFSFILLVITGFMARFPDAWWVSIIRSQWITMPFFEMRGYIHRGAAVALTSLSLFHIAVIIFTRHGRKFAFDMLPRWSDVKDAFVNVFHLLGLSSKAPRFGRFSYAEKAEYWALVWGTAIMFASGVFIWFYVFFMGHFGRIAWDVAKTIHYYEAILAALAIIVWHFYFVLFKPGVYPMNKAWITGKISEEEMEEEHPLELERILRQSEKDQTRESR